LLHLHILLMVLMLPLLLLLLLLFQLLADLAAAASRRACWVRPGLIICSVECRCRKVQEKGSRCSSCN
jgi:hypothetical protein